jgi:hypothetical protein
VAKKRAAPPPPMPLDWPARGRQGDAVPVLPQGDAVPVLPQGDAVPVLPQGDAAAGRCPFAVDCQSAV